MHGCRLGAPAGLCDIAAPGFDGMDISEAGLAAGASCAAAAAALLDCQDRADTQQAVGPTALLHCPVLRSLEIADAYACCSAQQQTLTGSQVETHVDSDHTHAKCLTQVMHRVNTWNTT